MQAAAITAPELRQSLVSAWDIEPPPPFLDWAPENIRFAAGAETPAFALDDAPYVAGVVRRFWEDPKRKKANLCWGVRLGKTSLLYAFLFYTAVCTPRPCALMYPDSDMLGVGVSDHLWPMADACPAVRAQLPPLWARNKQVLRFSSCRLRLAAGGKKSSVSGYPAQVIGKTEHDKNPLSASSEADPSARMDSRAAGYTRGVKIIEEGSPASHDRSRAAAMLDDPDVMVLHYWCPCPHCSEFAPIEFEQLVWEKGEGGRESSTVARQTARYICPHCEKAILDHERAALIRGGLWVAEGESIEAGEVVGTADAADAESMVFQLSSLYSLRIPGWGTIAAEYVQALHAEQEGRVELMRKFYTETLGIPWREKLRRSPPHAVALAMAADDHDELGTVPDWVRFLTLTADIGLDREALAVYWMICGWGSNEPREGDLLQQGSCRGGIIEFGVTVGLTEFLKEWRGMMLPRQNGPPVPVWGCPAAFDSGAYTQQIYDFCAPIRNAIPLKADSRGQQDVYRYGYQLAGKSKRMANTARRRARPDLFLVGTQRSQTWRQSVVTGLVKQGSANFVSLPADVVARSEHYSGLLEELAEDTFIAGRWVGDANEFGDTLRYGWALANSYVDARYGGRWAVVPRIVNSDSSSGPRVFTRG